MLLGIICTVIILDFIEVHESEICLRIYLAVVTEKQVDKQGKLTVNEPGITKARTSSSL